MQIERLYHLHREASMRTTLNIDDAALAGAMKTALREYARRRRVRRILDFRGRAHWEGDLDELRGRDTAAC
jgi:Arc/MetJ family transcription regulator